MEQQTALRKPGHSFYVTQVRDGRYRVLAGPFDTHAEALGEVDGLRAKVCAADPFSEFDSFGTMQRENLSQGG